MDRKYTTFVLIFFLLISEFADSRPDSTADSRAKAAKAAKAANNYAKCIVYCLRTTESNRVMCPFACFIVGEYDESITWYNNLGFCSVVLDLIL